MKTKPRVFARFPLFLVFSWWVAHSADAALSGVCSSVKLEIAQEATLERQAFDAMMRIQNGFTDLSLTDVKIEMVFKDAAGALATATSDPTDTNALFFIREDALQNISSLTAGTVEAGITAEIHWMIIPAAGAGGSNVLGQVYSVGAALTYRLRGENTTLEVSPDKITVLPMPLLTLDYFLPERVYGDDPWTDPIEPEIPFSLGLRVRNDGYGPARNLKVESAQPRITENLQGLLVGFEILGSEVNGFPSSGSLLADLGTVQTGCAGVARWEMTATLMGKFKSFEASITHADELGGQLTSLIQASRTHVLVRDVWVDLPGRDAIRDFLGRDGEELKVYESDAVETAVTNWTGRATLTLAQGGAGDHLYDVVVPASGGPFYAEWSYEDGTTREVASVVRADGKVLKAANAWIEKRREHGTDPWQYRFCLFDTDRGGAYRVTFAASETPENQSPVLAYIGNKAVAEGETLGFLVRASDPDATAPALTAQAMPGGAAFTHKGAGEGEFYWQTKAGDYGVHPVRFSASDGEFEDWEIVRIYVGHPGEPLTNGVPESLADWQPEIEDLWASSRTNETTVWWEAAEGMLYEMYSSVDPFAPAATWQKVAGRLQGSGATEDLLDQSVTTNEMRKYYRVVLAGDEPDPRNVWGVIRRDVAPGYTLISPPVRTDRRFDGEMGAALAEQLHGNNGGIGSGADEVYVLQPDGSWRTLYLDAAKTWREADGSASTYELPAGLGLWVARKTGTPVRMTFTGPVGNDGTQSVALNPGFNLIGLSEGKNLPLAETLASARPVGGASEDLADELVVQQADGTWRFLMYVTNWGVPYDGQWFDLNSYEMVPTNEVLVPGAAYYYLRRGDATGVEF